MLAAGFAGFEGADGAIIWDVAREQRLSRPLNASSGLVAFSPDDKTLATGPLRPIKPQGDGSNSLGLTLWDFDPESWRQRACKIANRNLSWAEWQQDVGLNVPYERTIPELPAAPAHEARARPSS